MTQTNARYASSGFKSVVRIRLEAARRDGESMTLRSVEKKLSVPDLIIELRQRYASAIDSGFAAGGASLGAEVTTLFDTLKIEVEAGNEAIDKASQAWRGKMAAGKADIDRLAERVSSGFKSVFPVWIAIGSLAGALAGFLLGRALRAAGIFSVVGQDTHPWYSPASWWDRLETLATDGYHYLAGGPRGSVMVEHPVASVLVPIGIILFLAIIGGWWGSKLGDRHRRKRLFRLGDAFMNQADGIILGDWQMAETEFVEEINHRMVLMKGR
jgi:hypothetical protein